ncbi:MAG: response regulator [Anaerolineae bacterium]|nr:response regulator [Anaerolineae bacterium]
MNSTKILIVEDESIVALDISKKLKRMGYDVVGHSDTGEDAVTLAKQTQPDILLMDIHLKGKMDGIQAANEIRTHLDVPVVFVTAYADDKTLQRALQTGPFGYIVKPFEQSDLRTTLEVALHKSELENKLRLQKAQFEQVFQRVPDGVCLIDSRGYLVMANPRGYEYLKCLADVIPTGVIASLGGCPLTELLTIKEDRTWRELVTTQLPTRVFEAIADAVDAETVSHTIATFRHSWVLTIREVTHEREIQERGRQQDRLAAVGQLAAGIAHDFNNILASIILKSELLRIKEAGMSSKSQEYLSDIHRQSRRASELVNQILDFSRTMPVEMKPVDLRLVVSELTKMLDRVLPETIKLELRYDDREYRVLGDSTRLLQTMMNLAINARDAMPNGGDLTLELIQMPFERVQQASKVPLDVDKWICLRFSDTGEGIPSEALPHIFEPFFTTKPIGQGTGLGLAQVYGIVKQHSGFINVHSQLDVGTTFEIYYPSLTSVKILPEAVVNNDLQFSDKQKRETVLVVEDEESVRDSVVDVLSLLDYEVLTAQNGREAIAVYDQHSIKISAVITDLLMPVLGGVELCTELRKRNLHLPIVVMSGYASDSLKAQIKELNIEHWIQKPVSIARLAETLAGAIQRENSGELR